MKKMNNSFRFKVFSLMLLSKDKIQRTHLLSSAYNSPFLKGARRIDILKTLPFQNGLFGFVFLIFLSIFTNISFAQNNSDSLTYYLDQATENNPMLKSKYNDYLSALEKIPQVGALPDPELSAGFYLSPMEVLSGKQIADFKLMQMFPWFGTLKSSKDEALSMANAKLSSFNEAKLNVHNELKTLWFQLYSNKKEIEYNTETINLLKSLENISIGKYQNASFSVSPISASTSTSAQNSETSSRTSGISGGSSGSMESMNYGSSKQPDAPMSMQTGSSMGNSSDLVGLFKLQLEELELENNIKLLKDEQKTLFAKFNSLLNRDLSMSVTIADTLYSNYSLQEYQTAMDSLKLNNPMIQMLEFDKQAYENKIKMSKKMGYPMLGAGLNYSIISKSAESTSMMNGKDMIMPMLTVSLPIYRKKYNAMVKESELKINSTDELLNNTRNELEVQYIQALENLNDASRRIKLSSEQQELAQRSVNILISQYSTSGTEFDEILRMQIQLLNYKIQAAKALADYNIAVAMLDKLISKNN